MNRHLDFALLVLCQLCVVYGVAALITIALHAAGVIT